MPPAEDKSKDEITEESSVSKPVIGIIYPPPEVRNIVDKTASFVARNGPEFESRIRENEVNNPKFNFLNPQDPYHAYYQHKVKDFREGKGQEPAAPKGPQSMFFAPQQKLQEQVKIMETIIPKDPPPEYEFITDPACISAFDLDVVKLTAQFVARNGRQFLTNLMNREQRNYQFDFLRPQHSLFTYFTKLVEQYTKILIPPKDQLAKLRKEAENSKAILEQVKYRVEWAKFQERERQKEEELKERERIAYASIDWHDFVVVETVDFQPNETGNLPPPTTPEEVGARVIAQERFQQGIVNSEAVEMEVASSDEEDEEADHVHGIVQAQDDTQIQDMEEESDDEGNTPRAASPPVAPPPPPPPPSEAPQPPPLPPAPDQVIIKKDYDPKAPRQLDNEPVPDKFLISPITGEKIPADKIQEHMRIGLLDPTWVEKRGRTTTDKRDEEVYAPGSSIYSSLRELAETRTDIFGVGVEETQIGKKIGEEERREKKVIWDGHTASMEKVTQKARENISIEEQIAVIHKVKGLVADEEKEKIGPAMPKGGTTAPPPPHTTVHQTSPASTMSSVSITNKPPLPAATTPKNVPPVPKPPVPPPPRPQTQQVAPPAPPMMMMTPPQPPPMRPVMARPPMPPPMMGMPPQRPPQGGFMPPPPMGRPPMMPPQHQKPQQDDEPPSKKSKSEESLIPENEFLARNKGPVTFKIQVPNHPDKPEWQLNGQSLTFTLPLTDNVSVIKAKIHEALGMPAGKQKLQFEGLFIKDSNTLAYYNFTHNCVLQLHIKERGGRKK